MKYFGTDGFRGEANVSLNVVHAYKVGRFLGNYYKKNSGKKEKIVIGKDTRCSGDMFESALCAGITASGTDVYLMGVIPTPGVSYITRTCGFACGVMISASHNPYHDNGLKVIDCNGHKLSADIEEKIEEYIDMTEDVLPFATDGNIGRVIDYKEGREAYAQSLVSLCEESFEGIKVALDCSNGSASTVAKDIFEKLGATVTVINDKPDGININDKCGSTHVEGLMEYVKESGADVGFAFDGDADRCHGVDELGNMLDGDIIMYICGCYLKEAGELDNDTVVTTVMSNLGLYKAFDKKNIKYEKTAVGDKYVYENMCKYGHRLGGEKSGHIIFSKYATTGDGILTALMMMKVIKKYGVKVSKLYEDLTISVQLLQNVRVKDKDMALNDADIIKMSEEIDEKLGSNGRLLLRKSGTEPVIRVMVEAESDDICLENVKKITDILEKNGHIV